MALYHALIRRGGEWTSGGVHVPSSEWSDISAVFERHYGKRNVTYTFWSNTSDGHLEDRIRHEVDLANTGQQLWDAGKLAAAGDLDQLNLARGIKLVGENSSTT